MNKSRRRNPRVDLTPDGRTLYTANGPSNGVTVIDTEKRTITTRIKAGESPWDVAVGRKS